jgi:hypothetical protein
MKRFLLAWLTLPIIASINGAIREFLYKDAIGELAAHQLSTLTLAVLFFVYVFAIRRWLNIDTRRKALQCSLIWVGLMLAFEFGFGLLVAGKTMRELLADYNFLEGRVWGLLVLFVAGLPFLLKRLCK